jgi:hypothetical protein
MTEFAVVAALDMVDILARSDRSVVTTDAVRRDRVMIEIGRGPRARRVAEFALIACHDMADILAFRRHAVMTAETVRRDCIVIETRIFPSARPVTIAA